MQIYAAYTFVVGESPTRLKAGPFRPASLVRPARLITPICDEQCDGDAAIWTRYNALLREREYETGPARSLHAKRVPEELRFLCRRYAYYASPSKQRRVAVARERNCDAGGKSTRARGTVENPEP